MAMEYPIIVMRTKLVFPSWTMAAVLLAVRFAAADIVTVTAGTDDVNGDTASIAALIASPGTDGISLREAILATQVTPGHDEIRFSPGGWIILDAGLPPLVDPAGTTITAGESLVQIFGYREGVETAIDIRSPDNQLTNLQLFDVDGVTVRIAGEAAQRNIIEGCAFSWEFYMPIGGVIGVLIDDGASENVVEACHIVPCDNFCLSSYTAGIGVLIDNGAHHNRVGGLDDGQGNEIHVLCNPVVLRAATHNLVRGNLLALITFNDVVPLQEGNGENILSRACLTGSGTGIDYHCLVVQASHENSVQDNTIVSYRNPSGGVLICDGSTENLIGGTSAGDGNRLQQHGLLNPPPGQWGETCSSPSWGEIRVEGVGTDRNVIQGNDIGSLRSPISPTPLWRSYGIWVLNGAKDTLIGGDASGAGNWIAEKVWGIVLSDSAQDTVIQGNSIGYPADDWRLFSNWSAGIVLSGEVYGTLIGGDTAAAGNLICGNLGPGLLIDTTGSGNTVRGNTITGNEFPNYGVYPGSNDGIQPPWIQTVSPIGGQARPGAEVVVYAEDDLSLTTEIASGTATETGAFSLPPEVVVPAGKLLLAVQTDTQGNTSGIGFHNHSGDSNGDQRIDIVELLRLIQFYNVGGYHCVPGTEDGYAPGLGDQGCAHHAGDYSGADWAISLSELLRFVQFYNSDGYIVCLEAEDGYCPGSANPIVDVW